jgi:copper homeostasis protein
MRVAVEICVTSVAEAIAAESAGADSVEICTWLACGGVTPSSGLVDAIRTAVRIPVRVLLRPTPDGFVHDPAAIHALLLDAEIYGGGAIGLVTGGLKPDGSMDRELMRSIAQLAPESEITFHRAVDHAADPMEILEGCLALGIDRLLTSGGATLAKEGVSILKRLVDKAEGNCQIAAAGGINAENVVGIVERSGVPEVHFAAQRSVPGSAPKVALSSSHPSISYAFEPDVAKIEAVMNALVKAGLR